jgi:hypothetical protein
MPFGGISKPKAKTRTLIPAKFAKRAIRQSETLRSPPEWAIEAAYAKAVRAVNMLWIAMRRWKAPARSHWDRLLSTSRCWPWRAAYLAEANPDVENTKTKVQAFRRAVTGLQEKVLIAARDGFVWRPV